jgi:hypothetical protein
MQGVIEVARAGHADIVAVGNEVLLREDMGEDELLACIQRVKDALPGVPVGYVDAYYLFEKHPRITAACDVVMTNCYPFWEGCPREQALAYMQTMVARTRAAAPGKRVLISETGWPDQGSAFQARCPRARRDAVLRRHLPLGRRRRHRGVLLRRLRRSLEGGRRGRRRRLLGPVGQGRRAQVRLTMRHTAAAHRQRHLLLGLPRRPEPRRQGLPQSLARSARTWQLLRRHWPLLRLYDCSPHAERVLQVIEEDRCPFQVMLGAYLGAEMNNFGCPWGGTYTEEQLEASRARTLPSWTG